jgi:hypothetical protein
MSILALAFLKGEDKVGMEVSGRRKGGIALGGYCIRDPRPLVTIPIGTGC